MHVYSVVELVIVVDHHNYGFHSRHRIVIYQTCFEVWSYLFVENINGSAPAQII